MTDSLIEECVHDLWCLQRLAGDRTAIRGTASIGMALAYLARDPRHASTVPNTVRADAALDVFLEGRQPFRWNHHPNTVVYTIDAPFGAVDRALSDFAHFTLIIKEYRTHSGAPDRDKLHAMAHLHRVLYEERKRAIGFPQSELIACTDRRQLSKRSGQNLAYEYCPHHAGPHVTLAQTVEREALHLARYCNNHPTLRRQARRYAYDEKLTQSITGLAPWLPGAVRSHLVHAAARDSQRLQSTLAAEEYVPHVDPKSTNIVLEEDGGLRFIDLEKVPYLLVSRDDLRAHIWPDPSYGIPESVQETMLGSAAFPAVYNYCVRRVQRALGGHLRAPLPAWQPHVNGRLAGYVANLVHYARLVQEEYPTARMLAEYLNPETLVRSFLEVHDHRGA